MPSISRYRPNDPAPGNSGGAPLEETLERFFTREAPIECGDKILAAYSGGADSTALLVSLCDYARRREFSVHAAHIDHGLDPDSSARADAAAVAAARIGVPLLTSRHRVASERRSGESSEVVARRVRYRELERIATQLGARYVATAHHSDDQAETLLLRLCAGHDVAALSGIPKRRGNIIRPLLSRTRRELSEFLEERGCSWTEDSTNTDFAISRNRARHLLLPRLEEETPDLGLRLAALARAADGANARISRTLDAWLCPRTAQGLVHVSRRALAGGPRSLVPWAVPHLLRRCGCLRRPTSKALAHLAGLLTSGGAIGIDLGAGWRIEDAPGSELRILKTLKTPERIGPFAHDLSAPGEVRLARLACWIRLRPGHAEPWMFEGSPLRAGLTLPHGSAQSLTVRNRRPGDRVQPLGSSHRKKLKNLLIDHGIPANERDRLPLLCHSNRVLWVPGVTIDHRARIKENSEVWIAEIIPDE